MIRYQNWYKYLLSLEQDSIDILEELGCEYKGKLKMLVIKNGWIGPSKDGIKDGRRV